MSRSLRVALVQLAVEDGRPGVNLERATAMMRAAPPADLFVLPELWTTGYAHESWARIADDETPAVLEAIAALSSELDAYIAGSMIARNARGGLVNRLWVVAPETEPARLGSPHAGGTTHYDKGHLFAPMGEDRFLVSGGERVATTIRGWTTALSICFDLRFPEMYRADALDGAELFLVASEWPSVRAGTQRLLARARAIENQAFLTLCNRVGTAADGTRFGGGSIVVAPDGAVIADAGGEEVVVHATIDVATLESVRSPVPLIRLRREGLDWAAPDAERGTSPSPAAPGAPRQGPAAARDRLSGTITT